MKSPRLLLPIVALATLVFVGASCWTTTVNVNVPANTNTGANTLSVTLTINKGTAGETKSYTATVAADDTALDLLNQVAAEENFAVQTQTFDFGVMINGIDGVEATDTVFWLYYVNDVSASVGADAYQLNEGDKVEFRYTSG